jgi:glutamine synthetase
MLVYGEGNEARMTGRHETASYDKFSWGIANRGASCRVNRAVAEEGKGYFEDRRPASNADPYRITGIIMETVSFQAATILCSVTNKVFSCTAKLTVPT